jgi:predicted thioesterase
MDFDAVLKPGLKGEVKDEVTKKNVASVYAKEAPDVYATPAMIGLMENACVDAVKRLLPVGFSTVGAELSIKHIAATPPGMTVRAIGELVSVDRKALSFRVEAWDEKEKIGEGTHLRFIIDSEKFMQKTGAKK